MTIKELVQKCRKINNSIKEDENQIETYKYEMKILELKNKGDDTKVISLQNKIEFLKKRIDKNTEYITMKKRLFDVPIQTILEKVFEKLQKDYPDQEISKIINTIECEEHFEEDFYKVSYLYKKAFEYGYKIKDGKKYTFKYSSFDHNNNNAATMLLDNKPINLIDCDILNKNENFATEDWQDLFWELFENNIRKELVRLGKKNTEEKEELDRHYKDECENILS